MIDGMNVSSILASDKIASLSFLKMQFFCIALGSKIAGDKPYAWIPWPQKIAISKIAFCKEI